MIVQLLITIILVGVALWAVNSAIPMEARIKNVLNVVVVVLLVLWVLNVVFGPLPGLPRFNK